MKAFYSFVFLILLYGAQAAIADDRVISGKVVSKQGTPLPGATVIAKGTATGAYVNQTGNIELPFQHQ
jgi:hypothetical protein